MWFSLTGWHIDGSFQEKPFSHSIYHIIECPREGDTVFASLTEIIERLDKKKREYWEKLYMASDRRGMKYKIWYGNFDKNCSRHKSDCILIPRVLKDLIWTDQIRSKNHYFNDLDLILDQHLSRWSWSDLRSFLRMIWSEMI